MAVMVLAQAKMSSEEMYVLTVGTERLERVRSSRRATGLEMGMVLMILPRKNADGYERWREEEEERREKRREVMGSEASSGVNKLSMGGTTVVESSVYGRSTGNRVATAERSIIPLSLSILPRPANGKNKRYGETNIFGSQRFSNCGLQTLPGKYSYMR
jgi:hypothetical protein